VDEPFADPLLEPPLLLAVAVRFVAAVDFAGLAVLVPDCRPPDVRLVSVSDCA
jgi:hypothetical protein